MKGINLLPPELIEKRLTEKRIVYLLGILIVLFLLMSFVFMVTYGKEFQENVKLSQINAENKKLEKAIAEFKIFEERKAEVQRREEILSKAMAGEIPWYKILNELSMVIPSEVCLQTLDLDSIEGLKVTGYTYDYSSVAKWMVRMGEIKELNNVWVETAVKAKEQDKDVVQFSMTAELAGSTASGQPAPSQ